MTLFNLLNKTPLSALAVAGLVGITATAASATPVTVWGASDAGRSIADFQGGAKLGNHGQISQPIATRIPGAASGSSDADPTAGNRNISVNVISGGASAKPAQLSLNKTFNPEVDTRY